MEYPHETLIVSQLSMAAFVERGDALLNDAHHVDPVDAFVRFVLAGRDFIQNEEYRVFLNPREEVAPLQRDQYSIRRDYDSLIGITRTLPFRRPIAIYPFPPFKEALQASDHTHITYPIQVSPVSPATRAISILCLMDASAGHHATDSSRTHSKLNVREV